jgi:type I restriction enzyme S subunit
VVPEDWREGALNDICAYNSERVSVSNLTLDTYISTENMAADRGGFVRATNLPTISQTTAFTTGDTLISNIRPYFRKIVFCGFDGGCSTDVLCFRPNNANLSHYVYNLLCRDSFFDYMVSGSKGTKMPRGDKQQIMAYPITIPTDATLDDFIRAVAPMVEKRLLLTGETTRLAVLRDTLLPRLMSGELSVADV